MPERHTSIVSRRPFINWSSGSIVSPLRERTSRAFPSGDASICRSPTGILTRDGARGTSPGTWDRSSAAIPTRSPRVCGSIRVWGRSPAAGGRSPGLWDRSPGVRRFIATRETIVPERETIVPGRETIVPRHDTSVDRHRTCVARRESLVATGSGSLAYDQTPHARHVAFEPTGRGRVGCVLGIARHACGDRSRAPILRSLAHGDRSRARGDRRSRPILLPKTLILRSFTPSRPPFRPNQGDSPRGQRGTTRIHVG